MQRNNGFSVEELGAALPIIKDFTVPGYLPTPTVRSE